MRKGLQYHIQRHHLHIQYCGVIPTALGISVRHRLLVSSGAPRCVSSILHTPLAVGSPSNLPYVIP